MFASAQTVRYSREYCINDAKDSQTNAVLTSEQKYPFILKLGKTMTNTEASKSHKQAAKDHQDCAKHHTAAAENHDKQKMDAAKASSTKAMHCCEAASKQSATACSNSGK